MFMTQIGISYVNLHKLYNQATPIKKNISNIFLSSAGENDQEVQFHEIQIHFFMRSNS